MTALFLLTAAQPTEHECVKLIREVSAFYANMKSFEADIEHDNSSGLFPGKYTQRLKWTGKGKFTLKVTKASDYLPIPDRPGGQAPDYQADGKVVRFLWRGEATEESVIPEPNTSPGWEVSGGMALSALERTRTVGFFVKPPEGLSFQPVSIRATTWRTKPVREVKYKIGDAGDYNLYVQPDSPLIVGAWAPFMGRSLNAPDGGWDECSPATWKQGLRTSRRIQ